MHSLALTVLLLSTSSSTYSPAFPGGIIAWIVCYKMKRRQFGGWLLFYYWQLYSGIVITLVFFFTGIHNYVRDYFAESRTYYLLLASTVPVYVLYALQVAVATIMISVHTFDFLKLLRWIMIAQVAAELFGSAIDFRYFPDNLFFDVYSIVQSLCWLTYFFRSRRVIHVFRTHDWDSSVGSIYPLRLAT